VLIFRYLGFVLHKSAPKVHNVCCADIGRKKGRN
jgi:hypothetical protein